MNETKLHRNPYSPEKRNDSSVWVVSGGVAMLLLLIGLGVGLDIRSLRASPFVGLALGDQNISYIGLEITHYPLCSPWAVGKTLIMKCPPGTTYAAKRYLRIWQGWIHYYHATQEIQGQSATLLWAQVLP